MMVVVTDWARRWAMKDRISDEYASCRFIAHELNGVGCSGCGGRWSVCMAGMMVCWRCVYTPWRMFVQDCGWMVLKPDLCVSIDPIHHTAETVREARTASSGHIMYIHISA